MTIRDDVRFYVDTGASLVYLLHCLMVQGNHTEADARRTIEEMTTDKTLTVGPIEGKPFVVVTEWSPNMAAKLTLANQVAAAEPFEEADDKDGDPWLLA